MLITSWWWREVGLWPQESAIQGPEFSVETTIQVLQYNDAWSEFGISGKKEAKADL